MTVDTIERSRAHLVVIADLAAQAAKHDDEALRHTALGIELRQTIATLERVFGADPIPASTEPPSTPLAETGEGVRPHALPDSSAVEAAHDDPRAGGVNVAMVASGANAGGENVTAAVPSTEGNPGGEAAASSPTFTSPDAPFRDPNDIEDEDGAQPVTEPADDLRRRKQVHQRVKAALAAHPDWTIREIAEYAGCSVSLAGRWVKSIRGPVRPSGQETLGAKLAVLVADRGQVTIREAIEAIGGTPGGIAAAARRAGIELRKVSKEEHAEKTKAGMAAKDAPAAAPKPTEEVLPPARAKQSMNLRFYLRDELGRYLHQSLERSPTDTGPLMTSNRKWAWFDNERRYEGALRKWPVIAVLRREVPQ